MAIKDWLIGTLRPDGYLKTESEKILLTTFPKSRGQVFILDKHKDKIPGSGLHS